MKAWRSPLQGVVLYLLLGGAWVFGGDALLDALVPDRATLVTLQSWKGGGYIVLTAVLAAWLLRRATRAEGLMRASEQELSQLFEQSQVGMGIAGPDGRWLRINQCLAELLGEPLPALQGAAVPAALRPPAGAAAPHWHAEVAWPPQAPVRWLSVSLAHTAAGLPRDVLVVKDISDLKQAEQRRLDGERWLQQFIQAIPTPVWFKDLAGRYQLWNPAFERLVPESGLVQPGVQDTALFGPQQAAIFREQDQQALAGGLMLVQDDPVQRPDGSVGHVEITKTRLLDAQGRPAGVLGIAHDITDRVQVAAELRAAQARSAQLLMQSQASRQALLSVVEDHQRAEMALRDSQARLDAVLRALPDVVMLWDRHDLRCVAVWNGEREPNRSDWLGPGMTLSQMAAPALQERFRRAFHQVDQQGTTASFEVDWVMADGTQRCFEVRIVRAGREQYVVVARDISAQYRLLQRQRMYAAVVEHTQEAVAVLSLSNHIVSVNPALVRLLGYEEHELLAQKASMLRSADSQRVREIIRAVVADGQWRGEVQVRRKDGQVLPCLLSVGTVLDESGQPSQRVLMYSDISRLKRSEAELSFLAHHDPLTQLPNRLLFQGRLEQAVAEAGRGRPPFATLMLDLDHFKNVNDSWGHLAGDELLRQVAHRLSQRLRRSDTLARLGGDEFAILIDDVGHPEDAARLAGELIASLAAPMQLGEGVEVTIGASVGISLFPDHGSTPASLMQGADAALYHAKAAGRGVYRFFSDDMTRLTRERLELEQRLRRAVAQNHLLLHYQPQVDIATGRIVGAEALVRWLDPVDGIIPPMKFIPVAEATGLIADIGLWVLREACRQGRAWMDAGLPPLTLAVNVSPRQFHHGDLAAQVTQVLADTGLPPERLELEVTESALMERETEALEMLQRLRALGVGVAIDDFGTGYSSLAYLRRFPLDTLKIDRSFIAEVPQQEDDMAIATAIIAMGHSLDIQVLAEGVETQAQLEFLRRHGCDRFQGYLRSKPLPAAEFETLWVEPATA